MQKISLDWEINSILETETLSSEEREFFRRWQQDDPRKKDVSSKIEAAMQRAHGEFAKGLRRPFLYDVLAVRAGYETDSRLLLKQAKNARELAEFLQALDSRVLLPKLPHAHELIPSLEELAKQLRDLAGRQKQAGLKQKSRIDRDGSRSRVNFMHAISELLRAYCHRRLDEAVIYLTDLAFPSHQTTLDQVISARKTTRRPRGRPKLAK